MVFANILPKCNCLCGVNHPEKLGICDPYQPIGSVLIADVLVAMCLPCRDARAELHAQEPVVQPVPDEESWGMGV